ncbi:MAG: response regulator transcription factor [Myxococcales bacterium]|nr:response regulator transcription factor [Myxococcales bacterium]
MSEKLEILVVEDEPAIREGLCDVLAFHGYQPTAAAAGDAGLALAESGRFALVLLDVMLPGMNGLDVCHALRARRPFQPIVMLTAKGAENDIVEGFRRGADDYVPKPFSVRELLVRIEAVLRRSGRAALDDRPRFRVGPWEVQPDARQAVSGGTAIELTPRELDVLTLLARERGRVVSRDRLLQDVWGFGNVEHIHTRTIDMHVAKLRKKLGAEGEALIETVRGEGYRMP